jgi:small subunit ribosomal protein S3e
MSGKLSWAAPVLAFRMRAQRCSKVRRIIETGLFYAELNELLTRELAVDGYGGCEVRMTPSRTEIIIKASNTGIFTDQKGRRLQELRLMILKRWNIKDEQLEIFIDRIQVRGLCALNQLESLRYKIVNRIPARRAAYSIIRFVMEANAQGCEVVIAGKMRSARAQVLKFRAGIMLKAGEPVNTYVARAVGHIPMKQAVVGIRVAIMLPHDPRGIIGPKEPRPDLIVVSEEKK